METDINHNPEPDAPPAALAEQVRDALENLYDRNYLERHILAQDSQFTAEISIEIAGQRLRGELIAAIESLSPGPSVSFQAPQARMHNLLVLHYVECRTVQEAAHMADISRRQAHRDLRLGVEKVASVLWARQSTRAAREPSVSRLSSVATEVAQLTPRPSPTDVGRLLQEAHETVRQLAAQREVRLHFEMPRDAVIVSADPAVAGQVLVNLLSSAIQQAQPGAIHLKLSPGQDQASISLRYFPEPAAATARPVNVVVEQLADQLGWRLERKDHADGTRIITLRMAVYGPSVLVIDDNEGLVNLLSRYLTDQACQMISATNGQQGLQLAKKHVPDAIILDVMVPHVHGWEVLQRLRHDSQTAHIPIIVCSVINDPGLAYSLGASLFLAKPISRAKVLEALQQLKVL
jgi:CheY-like chemotaxis protein